MKKIILCIGIFMILVYLSSCDYNDYTDEIMLIKEELILKIPLEINSDFVFPVFEDYDITWAVNDIIYNDVYDYQTPITDTDILMEITIKKGISSITFNHSVKLLNRAFSSYQTEIYIELDESIDDINKDTYFDMQTTIYSEINGQEQNILNLESGGIRGRGNSTWGVYPKKPYKLKFDQRVSILGMPNAKEYVLLAEYADPSLMRNVITHQLSTYFDLRHIIETRYVDLYINSEYLGVYVLTEQIEEDKNKLDLSYNQSIDDISFFIELDMRYDDNETIDPNQWIYFQNQHYEIKSLNSNNDTYLQSDKDKILNDLNQAYQALLNQTNYEDYCDIDQWIDYFIIQEITKNVDVGYSSVFMFKDQLGRLTFGPLWDFDFAFGNANYIDYGYEGFYGLMADKNIWYHLMMEIPEVRIKYKERFLDFYLNNYEDFMQSIYTLYETLIDDSAKDDSVWDRLGTSWWPNPSEVVSAHTYTKQYIYLYNYIDQRILWLSEAVLTLEYNEGNFELL